MAKKTYKVRKLRNGEIRIDFTGTPKQNLATFSALSKALGGRGLQDEPAAAPPAQKAGG